MTVYRFGPFRLEKEPLLLSLGGESLPLGPKVVETLLALLEHPGEVLTKGDLLHRVWPEGFVDEANLAQNVYVIRKALRPHLHADPIETVPRRGYRFTESVHIEHVAYVAPVQRVQPRFRLWFAAATLALVVLAAGAGMMQVARSHSVSTRGLSPSGARLYSMGKYYWNQRTAAGVAKSERYFEAVIGSDPRDGRGYAGLASSYAIEGDYGYAPLSQKAALARAASYAHAALARNPNSAEAYAVLGLVDVDRRRMARALGEYRHALAIDPAYAPAHQWYGAALLRSGKSLQAFAELEKAANLDPESVAAADWLSQAAFISRRYEDAISYGHQALDLSPQRYEVYQTIGMAYEALGNYRAAIGAYRAYGRTCEACRYDAAALLAHAYALSRDSSDARRELLLAQRGVALRETAPENMVAALAAMGRKREALDMLRRMKTDEPATLLAIDPRMDALRTNQQFVQYTQGPG